MRKVYFCISKRKSFSCLFYFSVPCNAGERTHHDQASAILGSNSEEAWEETKEVRLKGETNMAANLLDSATFVNTRKTPALQANISHCLEL